jgi:hypothetical protein
MLELDLEKAQFLVDQAIKQKGEDYTYEKDEYGNCAYVHYDEIVVGGPDEWGDVQKEPDLDTCKMGCLVGAALIKGGIEPEWFVETGNNTEPASTVLYALSVNDRITYTREADEYLTRLQESQDKGAPWRIADALSRSGEVWVKPQVGIL